MRVSVRQYLGTAIAIAIALALLSGLLLAGNLAAASSASAAPVASSSSATVSALSGGCKARYIKSIKARLSSCIKKANGAVTGELRIRPRADAPRVYKFVASTITYAQTSPSGTSEVNLVVAKQFLETAPFNRRLKIKDTNYRFTPQPGQIYRELTYFQVYIKKGSRLRTYKIWSPPVRITGFAT